MVRESIQVLLAKRLVATRLMPWPTYLPGIILEDGHFDIVGKKQKIDLAFNHCVLDEH